MSTVAPEKPVNEHGEEIVKPRFGPGSDYDPQKTPLGNTADPRGDSEPLTDEQIKDKEAGETSQTNSAERAEQDSLYKGDEAFGRFSRLRVRINNARYKYTLAAGTFAATMAVVGMFGIAQGPLSAIHLGKLLQIPQNTNENSMSLHMRGFYKYLRTNDIGETRVTKLGSLMSNKIIRDLKAQGIEFDRTNAGSVKGVRITIRDNLALKDMSAADRITAVADEYGVDKSKVRVANGVVTVDFDGTTVEIKQGFINKSLGLAGMNTKLNAMSIRQVYKFYNLHDIFHPMQRAAAALEENRADTRVKKQAEKVEEERQRLAKSVAPSPEVKAKLSDVKNSLSNSPSVAKAVKSIMVADAYCTAKEAIEAIPLLTMAMTIAPSMIGAYTAMGYGSQAQAGIGGISAAALGLWVSTFKDKDGGTIWQSKALNALSGKSSGIEVDKGIKQAFSPQSSVSGLQKGINSVKGGDFTCSVFGKGIQFVVGGAALLVSGGTSTIALQAAKGVAVSVAFDAVISYIQHLASGPDVSGLVFGGGPLGGSLMALGSMAAANQTGRSMGGVALSQTASMKVRQQNIAMYNQDFQSKPLATRMFSLKDSRSLLATTITSTNLTPSTVLNSVKKLSFVNVLLPKVSAQETAYEWPMPVYTIPNEVFTKYPDPYENADEVEKFIDNGDYKDRANICFGVKISNDGDGWNVTPDKDTNPASADYEEASCNDEDEKWQRIMKFVGDTRAMSFFACGEGDPENADVKQACQDQYVEGGVTEDTSNNSQSTNVNPPDSINGMPLTDNEKKHLKFIKDNVVSLLEGNSDKQAQLAAESSWWSLREGVLNLDDQKIIGYSNCGTGNGNTHIGVLDSCPASTWQVGIGAVQVPNFTSSQVSSTARARHPGKTEGEILKAYAILAGYGENSREHRSIINSTGVMRKSHLLRDPATGITLVNVSVQPCLSANMPSWCSTGRTQISANQATIKKSIDEIKAYFLASGTNTPSNSEIDLSTINRSSVDISCAPNTKDLGVQDGYSGGSLVKIRICAVSNINSSGSESRGLYGVSGADGKLIVNSRVSQVVYNMAEAARRNGVTLVATSGFRSHAHQTCLYNKTCGTAEAARPGYSNHQMGTAIDFQIPKCPKTINGQCSAPGNAIWDWLNNNAGQYGYKSGVPSEAWHWSPTGR